MHSYLIRNLIRFLRNMDFIGKLYSIHTSREGV